MKVYTVTRCVPRSSEPSAVEVLANDVEDAKRLGAIIYSSNPELMRASLALNPFPHNEAPMPNQEMIKHAEDLAASSIDLISQVLVKHNLGVLEAAQATLTDWTIDLTDLRNMTNFRKPAANRNFIRKNFSELEIFDKILLVKKDQPGKAAWAEVREVWHNEKTTCVKVRVQCEFRYFSHTHDAAVKVKRN